MPLVVDPIYPIHLPSAPTTPPPTHGDEGAGCLQRHVQQDGAHGGVLDAGLQTDGNAVTPGLSQQEGECQSGRVAHDWQSRCREQYLQKDRELVLKLC